MFLANLHAIRRHGPDLILLVDLDAPGADGFAGVRGGQDGELKRPRSDAGLLAQLDQKRRQFGIW